MPENKHVEIDDVNDLKDLFNLLCEEVLNSQPIDVRRGLLGFRGNDAAVMHNTIHPDDIFKIIKKHELKFSLRIEYTTSLIVKSLPAVDPILPAPVPDSFQQLERQKVEIPDYLLPKQGVEIKIEPDKPYRPPASDIPTFDF